MPSCPFSLRLFQSAPVTKEDVIERIRKRYADLFKKDGEFDQRAAATVAQNYLESIASMNERVKGLPRFSPLPTTKIHEEFLQTQIPDFFSTSNNKVCFMG
ncbi:MAG: hypothetical protein Q8L78_08235 [Coxiellaceae bacterium]|nr:hypothetical protein [Coxiellaceae bacterium]